MKKKKKKDKKNVFNAKKSVVVSTNLGLKLFERGSGIVNEWFSHT